MPRNQRHNSFIPKTDAINPPTSGGKRSGGSLFILFSFGLFIVAIIIAAGLFFYKQNVKSNLADKQQQLEQARSGFDPALINELENLSDRISTAKKLLNEHVAYTAVFPIIESATLKSVQYNSMKVSRKEPSDDGTPEGNSASRGVTITLNGVGPGYPTVALQSSEYADHDRIDNPVLSGFQLNNDGNVEFSVQLTIPEREILYASTSISNSGT